MTHHLYSRSATHCDLSSCRYLKDGKLKPIEGKQLPYLINAGPVADDQAEFKEYPVSVDKKMWFKLFDGDIDNLLDDIKAKTGIKVLVSGCLRWLFAYAALCISN